MDNTERMTYASNADKDPLDLLREIHGALEAISAPLFDSRSRKQADRADLGRRINGERARLLTAISSIEAAAELR